MVGNWQKEAARFTPDLPVMVHHGADAQPRKPASRNGPSDTAWSISSYALLHRDFDALREVDWAGVILDEAQNIKNPQTKQSQAARRSQPATASPSPAPRWRTTWAISGPSWRFLNPGLLGTQADFKRTFFIPIQANRDPQAAEALQRLTGPFILRRLKTDRSIIADLPEKMEMKVFCTLTQEQASLYAAVLTEAERALEEAEGIQRKGVVLATLSKLKQVCNHPAQFLGDNSPLPGRSGKLARLTEMLEELAGGRRPGPDLYPVRRDGNDAPAPPAGDLWVGRCSSCTAVCRAETRPHGASAFRTTEGAGRSSSCP